MGGPGARYGEWKSEKAKRAYVGMLQRHVDESPPPWLLIVAIAAVVVFGVFMVASIL